MAIVVEEDKRSSSHVFALAGVLVFLGAVGASVYYIFFAPAPASPISSPGGLNAIAPLTQSAVQPQAVAASPALASFHSTIPAPTSTGPVSVGRPNPFLAP